VDGDDDNMLLDLVEIKKKVLLSYLLYFGSLSVSCLYDIFELFMHRSLSFGRLDFFLIFINKVAFSSDMSITPFFAMSNVSRRFFKL